MPYKRYDIVSYVAWLQKETRDFGGFLEQAVPVQATITCHPSDRTDFDRLYFVFIDGTSFPQNRIRQRPNRKEVYIFVPASFYSPYIDLLRNEKPIAVRLDMERGSCMLGTAREAVGEG